jgi:predicted Rossmann fold flavoprotein
MNIAVIGGGAAGFFAAISAKEHHSDAAVTLFEKSSKVLSKVRISGGGRCNVTHACFDKDALIKHYPRGEKFLKKSFHQFQVKDTINWFTDRGVGLKTEKDNRMFPISDNSQSIIDALTAAYDQLGGVLKIQSRITSLTPKNPGFELIFNKETQFFDKVIVATGGSPKEDGLQWLKALGHTIVKPVPSLFTFNLPKHPITKLMGTVAPMAKVRIEGGKLASSGPLLITHWGMSGPAILKLSAFNARLLAECQYDTNFIVSWLGGYTEDQVRDLLQDQINQKPMAQLSRFRVPEVPKRLWLYLLDKLEIPADKRWNEFSKKHRNQLLNVLLYDRYQINGKTTFKEEFVTCGGVSLTDVHAHTLESKRQPGLYFAGEVLDIDGVTGGFNFQAAWTTGFIAGKVAIKFG